MHMLLMLGLVGVAALGASYVVGKVGSWAPNAGDIPTFAAVGLGIAAALFAPAWLAFAGGGMAIGAALRWVGQSQAPTVTKGQLSGDTTAGAPRRMPGPPGYAS